MMTNRPLSEGWSVVVPVRDFVTAKTRLRLMLPDDHVAQIARTLAICVVDALQRCRVVERICVVSDVDLSDDLASGKASVLVQKPGGGLNAAVQEGLAWASACAPRSPVLVIHADLPGITTAAVSGLLVDAQRDGQDSFLPDRDDKGTTLLTFRPGSDRLPAFGVGSAARHAVLGFTRFELPTWSGLRNDLDTFDDYTALMSGTRAFTQSGSLCARGDVGGGRVPPIS